MSSGRTGFSNVLFQLHWFLGITAGCVLAVQGLTGATLSFENEIQRALNPGVVTVPVREQPVLTPPELMAKVGEAEPHRRIGSVGVSSIPGRAARVGFAPPPGAGGEGERPRPASEAGGAPNSEGRESRESGGPREGRGPRVGEGGADAAAAGEPRSAATPDGERRGPRGDARPGEARNGPAQGQGPGGRARMDVWFADPYTGALLGREADLRGHATLDFLENVHRRLAVGEIGKTVTGISALCLVYFALSGLYLRWPRKLLDFRTWFAPRWRMKGRAFLISLHQVAGTWVLLLYLVTALTGMTWSFEWYRNAVNRVAGVTPQQRQPMQGGRGPVPDLTVAWQAFVASTADHGWSSASFNMPSGERPLQINYLDRDPPHERANNRIAIDPATGSVISNERYDDKTAGGRLVATIFPLHRGSWLGVPGVLMMMASSLCMPLFAVTGWMLYLRRRRTKRAMLAAAAPAAS